MRRGVLERATAQIGERPGHRFTAEPAKFGELYWAKVWQEGAQDLAGFMEGVKRFFAGAAARRDAVLFYIV